MLITIIAIFAFLLGAGLVFVLFESRRANARADRERAESLSRGLDEAGRKLTESRKLLEAERAEFGTWSISLRELEQENLALKQHLLNVATTVRKLRVDQRLQSETQKTLDQRGHQLAEQYLADVERWVGASINANNYAACKQRLTKAITWCRELGFDVSDEKEQSLLQKLKEDFEMEVRTALAREEQIRIKAQIREEQAREQEVQRELETLEREKAAIKAALERALADATLAHSGEVEKLKARLAEAEARGQRAIAQAQLTKAGHLYVISNIGSFGDSVFKIGMTRRLEPLDRVQELSNASVPFPFDVHMLIACDDVPALEKALHREYFKHRLNKVNPRKEFFRVDLAEVRRFIEARHGEIKFVADAEALQYRQSLTMSDEDQQYIDEVFEDAEKKIGAVTAED